MRKFKSLVAVMLATALILTTLPNRVEASDFLPEQNIAAQWTANAVKITFDSNGGGVAPNIQVYTYGVERSLPGACAMKKTGYTFAGWSTSSTATTAEWESGATSATAFGYADATKAIAKTLYAVWTETQTSTSNLKLVCKDYYTVDPYNNKSFGPYKNGGMLYIYGYPISNLTIDNISYIDYHVFSSYINASWYNLVIPFGNTISFKAGSNTLYYALYVYE